MKVFTSKGGLYMYVACMCIQMRVHITRNNTIIRTVGMDTRFTSCSMRATCTYERDRNLLKQS